MTFFDQVYQSLFPKTSTKNEVILYEPINRSASYEEDYTNWKNSYKRVDLVQKVYASYRQKQEGMIGDPDVHLLESSRSNGFAIVYSSDINRKDFQFLFDWLGEKVLALGYKKSNSDITITSKNNQLESVEKYYFKPKPSWQKEGPVEQHFGNVLIEHLCIDVHPSYIKLIANTYNDAMYKKAYDFEDLAEFLLSQK